MLEKTSRRGFLGAILAAAAAPAIVKAGVLMPVRPRIIVPPRKIVVYEGGAHGLRNGDIITMSGVYAPDGSLQRLRIKHMTQHTYALEAWR